MHSFGGVRESEPLHIHSPVSMPRKEAVSTVVICVQSKSGIFVNPAAVWLWSDTGLVQDESVAWVY